jgi:protein-arginine kinase
MGSAEIPPSTRIVPLAAETVRFNANARSLSFEETMNWLSGVRLGVGLNLITGQSVYTLTKLLIHTQTAMEGRTLSDSEERATRAS